MNKVSRQSHGSSIRVIYPRIQQIDLAPYVGASLEVMERDSKLMRGDGPTVFTSVKQRTGVQDVIDLRRSAWKAAGSPGKPGAVGDSE